ncbi:MAG: lytic transglycosylase domain-containing protein [Pseudomonadota bacterium]
MGALRLVVAALALVVARPAAADSIDRWQPLIAEAALRFGIPEAWIVRVMRAESGGATTLEGRPIRSSTGAMGLMQLMPATWAEMRQRLTLGDDPDDPRDNILAGALYLRLMYDRFGYPGLFAAYNAGPARYAAYLAGRQRLPGETVAYLGNVGGASGQQREQLVKVDPPALFAVRREPTPEGATSSGKAPQATLFAVRKDAE